MHAEKMKTYSIYLLSGIFIILICLSIFNWFVNPYDIFESPEVEGINKYKSEVERHTRLSKIYQLEKIKPDAILLASSRGLVVPESLFNGVGLTGFNLSLTSASTYELLRFLQHAQAVRPLKRVVLALDETFTGTKQTGFKENRLAVKYDGSVTEGKLVQQWQDKFSSLLSHDALKASFRTIRKQKNRPDVLNVNSYKAERVFKAGGHRQMFRTIESSIFSNYKRTVNICQKNVDKKGIVASSSLVYFEKMAELAYKNNIDLYIYFSPSHARFYEAKCIVGELNNIRNMKRQVVEIIEKLAVQYGMTPYPVWDFSGYNSITVEEVPDVDDKSSLMKWYWEGSHYTGDAADVLFGKIFGTGKSYNDFGVQISGRNIETHLNNISIKRDSYISTHDKDIQELNDLFETMKSKNR